MAVLLEIRNASKRYGEQVLLDEASALKFKLPSYFTTFPVWLVTVSNKKREACLIVSHDRGFLTATCDRTLDLSRGKLTTYPGKIDSFLDQFCNLLRIVSNRDILTAKRRWVHPRSEYSIWPVLCFFGA